MGSHKDVTREHLAHLKVVTSGAAPLPLNDIRRVIEKSSVSFINCFSIVIIHTNFIGFLFFLYAILYVSILCMAYS